MLNDKFVFLGVVFGLLGGGGYLIDTFRGRVQPNRVSWFIWAVSPLIAFAAQFQQGVGISSLMTFMVGFMPLLVFIASFFNKKSYWKISRSDLYCLGLALLGLILWGITRVGNIAILFSIMSDGFGSLPTVLKSWKNPHSESPGVYFFAMMQSLITISTLRTINFENFAFPVYIFLIDFILFVLIRFPLGRKLSETTSCQS
jgi:hypothetical protein